MIEQVATHAAIFADGFQNWEHVYARRNVSLLHEFPRVPSDPDVRVSPADLNYGVPPDMDLRDFAVAQNINVDVPYFKVPKQRRIRCGFFPLVLRLHSGDLLVVWREASAHLYCPFGRTVAARSTDGGHNWGRPWVIDFTLPDAWDAGGPENLVQTSDGTLWLGAWGRIPVPAPGTTGHQRPGMYALRSQDDGQTWEVLPKLSDGFQWSSSPMLEMSNGEFLWIGSAPYEPDEGLTAWESSIPAVMILKEDGEPAPAGADVVEMGGLRFERFAQPHLNGTNESHITETAVPGHLVMLLRSQAGEHYYQSTSRDYGRTWTPARPSDLWHSPRASQPFLLTLTDGTLVAVNDQRQNGRAVATPSFDNGETWDIAHQQVVLDNPDFFRHDFSYPELVEVGDGRLLSIYYNASHPVTENNGIFGTFLEPRFFRDAFHGVQLAEVRSVQRPGTVGYWRFDEGEGSIALDDTGPHYGKLFGPTWVPGRYGTALAFDGLDDYAIVTNCPTLWVGQAFTIEGWIRTEEPAGEQTIVSKLPHYWFGFSEGRLYLRRGGIGGLPLLTNHGNTVLEADRWYHVAIVVRVTADTIRRAIFYVDGSADANQHLTIPHSAADAQALSDWRVTHGVHWQGAHDVRQGGVAAGWAAQDHLYIGLQHDLKTAPFLGLIDELAIHAAGLTTAQLAESLRRRRWESGEVSSAAIKRPAGSGWGRFEATARVPAGTAIAYDVITPDGTVLRENISPGADLSTLEAPAVRLRAQLSTTDPGQTPTLWSWSLQG